VLLFASINQAVLGCGLCRFQPGNVIHLDREPDVKNDSRCEKIQADCAARTKLWQEYVANYQKMLAGSPEAFSAFSAEFRERYLCATQDR
jgi:hypothetical protein